MTYSKPEIVSLASASFAIQMIVGKGTTTTEDFKNVTDYSTVNGYEGDE